MYSTVSLVCFGLKFVVVMLFGSGIHEREKLIVAGVQVSVGLVCGLIEVLMTPSIVGW